jgi:hypothetical protein
MPLLSCFHELGLPAFPLNSVLIFHILPSLRSFPHPPPDLGPVKSLELSKCHSEVGWGVGVREGSGQRYGRLISALLSPLPFLYLHFPFFCPFPSIFPSPDQPANVPVLPPAMNTGGSLPDLTNLHFPPPLPTPLDPEETAYPSLSGGNSTSNLTHTMTHLGISGGLGLGPGYNAPGELLSWSFAH